MSISKNKKTGKWDCSFRVRSTDGTLKRTTKRGFATKTDAQRYEALHIHESSLSQGSTFRDVFESMSMSCRASSVTTEQRRTRIDRYCAAIADRPMKSITKSDFLAWRDSMTSHSLSTTTINDTIRLVKQVTRFAWETYDIPDNAKVMKPYQKELSDYHEMTIINFSQFSRLLDQEKDPTLKTFFQVLYMTGMRKGEARALSKSDYDPHTKSLHVYKSMRRDEQSIKTTKTNTSRWIPLDNDTNEKVSVLASHEGEFLFGDFLPLSNNKITTHFKQALKEANLPDMRIHDLRHSHVSLLWHNGVPVPEISKRLGHSSPKTTMEKYAHVFDNGQSASLAVLNNLVTPK